MYFGGVAALPASPASPFDDQGYPRIAVTPRFDLSVMFNLGAIAQYLPEPPDSHLVDETYRLTVDSPAGGTPVVQLYRDPRLSHNEGLRVVNGRFTLSSNRVAAPFSASTGQCLASGGKGANEHPIFGALSLVPCPQ